MALRLNTVEYAFPQSNTTRAAGAPVNFTPVTITIPETTNRTFISAYADIFTLDAGTTATSSTARSFDFRVGGTGGYLKNTVTQTITNSGENMSYHFLVDVSSQFATNFTGTSHVVDASFAMATQINNNTSCKLVITYQWDDVDNNRIKTVRIPIESSSGGLGPILANIAGGNVYQIPLLNTWLPEASKAYKDIFFESWGNENTITAATPLNPSLGFALDAEVASGDGGHQNTLVSARLYRRIWQRKDMSTNIEHTFKARTDASANMNFACLPVVLNVTYTYWEPSTLTVMNSVVIGGADETGYPGQSTSNSRFKRSLHIPEANPNLKQSGVLFSFVDAAGPVYNVRVGSQAAYWPYRAASGAGTVCGGFHFMHNFDSSSRGGIGVTLSEKGSLVVDWYTGSQAAGISGTNTSAIIYLNYTSDKSTLPGGSANHNQTIIPLFSTHQAVAALQQTITTKPLEIPENNRWMTGIVPVLSTFTPGQAQTPSSIVFSAQLDSSTDSGAGWQDLYAGTISMDSEFAPQLSFARARSEFKRWPYDTDTDRMYLEKVRAFKLQKPIASNFGSFWYITYHTMITNVNGTVSNFTGDGAGISIQVYDKTAWNNLLIYEGSTNVGGTFGFPWYNPSINISVIAYQNSTYNGSYYGPINSSANINFGSNSNSQYSWVF